MLSGVVFCDILGRFSILSFVIGIVVFWGCGVGVFFIEDVGGFFFFFNVGLDLIVFCNFC